MHPEQPRTGLALQKCQADSSPLGTQHTGLLRCLIQNARPLSFCFLVPRVQAAEVAAAQMSSTPSDSSSSTSPAATPLSSVSTMQLNIGKPEFADTGWDRLKDLFDKELVFFLSFLIYLPIPYLFGCSCQSRVTTFWGLHFLNWGKNNVTIMSNDHTSL